MTLPFLYLSLLKSPIFNNFNEKIVVLLSWSTYEPSSGLVNLGSKNCSLSVSK